MSVKHTIDGLALCEAPVFVIGSPRSGTTALARALARHSGFWTSHESYLLHTLYGNGRAERVWRQHYERKQAPSWLKTEGVGRDEFLAYLGLGVNALFSSRSGGRRWIDQTPLYTQMAEDLAVMFPGAQFLHILRDGRDVVDSMTNFLVKFQGRPEAEQYVPDWARDFSEACRTWRTWVEWACAFEGAHPDRCLTVRNDLLAHDPDGVFHEVLTFLGVPFEDGPGAYIGSTRTNSSFVGSTRRDSSEAGWDGWTGDQRVTFCEEASGLMLELGLATAQELDDWREAAPEAATS